MFHRSRFPDVVVPEIPLAEFILEHAQQHASRAALIDGPSGRIVTYGELAHAVDRVAAGLARRGCGAGDVFAIYAPNAPEYAIALLGVIRAGGSVHDGQSCLHRA